MSESVEDLKAQIRCAEETLKAWFDTSKRAKEQIIPALTDALSGYLRTCRCGGMPDEQSSLAEAVLSDFLRRHAGEVVTPIVEALAGERSAALASTAGAGAGAGDWVLAPRQATKAMLDAAYAAYDAYEAAPEPKGWGGLGSVYKAMIEAAPAVPASPIKGGEGEEPYRRLTAAETLAGLRGRSEIPSDMRFVDGPDPLASPPAPAEHGVNKRDWRDRSLTNYERLIVFASYYSKRIGMELEVELLEFAADWQDEIRALSQGGGAGRSERAVEISELSEKATQGEWDIWKGMPDNGPFQSGCTITVSEKGCTRAVANLHYGIREWGQANAAFVIALVNAYRAGELIYQPAPAQSPSTSDREG